MENHLWYVADETVGLALFSDNVSTTEKAKIVAGMTNVPLERHCLARQDKKAIKVISKDDSNLGDFSSARTATLLTRLDIGDSFLSIPPDTWSENDDYVQGKERVRRLRVVNGTAERGIKLFEEFNNLITNNEEEKQFLLQVVEANRKAVPTQSTKQSVIDAVLMN